MYIYTYILYISTFSHGRGHHAVGPEVRSRREHLGRLGNLLGRPHDERSMDLTRTKMNNIDLIKKCYKHYGERGRWSLFKRYSTVTNWWRRLRKFRSL